MPRIKLSQNPAIRMDFLAHIIWPQDDEKRDAFIALTNEASVAFLEEAQESSYLKVLFVEDQYPAWTKSIRDEFTHEVINPNDTAKSISLGHGLKSLGKETQKSAVNVFLTGYTVLALSTMIEHHADDPRLRGGPGIKKAQEVVADIQLIALSRVESAWAKHKTVAHFCAAATALCDPNAPNILGVLHDPTPEFISISQYFRLLLTQFKPHGRTAPLVSKNDLWLPPKQWDGYATKITNPPFPEELLNTLENRKAR